MLYNKYSVQSEQKELKKNCLDYLFTKLDICNAQRLRLGGWTWVHFQSHQLGLWFKATSTYFLCVRRDTPSGKAGATCPRHAVEGLHSYIYLVTTPATMSPKASFAQEQRDFVLQLRYLSLGLGFYQHSSKQDYLFLLQQLLAQFCLVMLLFFETTVFSFLIHLKLQKKKTILLSLFWSVPKRLGLAFFVCLVLA